MYEKSWGGTYPGIAPGRPCLSIACFKILWRVPQLYGIWGWRMGIELKRYTPLMACFVDAMSLLCSNRLIDTVRIV